MKKNTAPEEQAGSLVRHARLKAPVLARLELTYACRARCPGCPREVRSAVRDILPGSAWHAMIKKLAPYVGEVHLTGGEPVLHPDFQEITASLEREKVPFMLYTSGLWEHPGKVLAALKKCTQLKGITFSVHGHNEGTHDFFTGIRSYEEMKASLEMAARSGLVFHTAGVMGDFAKHYGKDIVKSVFAMGSRSHTFQRYIGPIRNGISMYRDDLQVLLRFIGELAGRHLPVMLEGCIPSCFHAGGTHCLSGITRCTLDPLGQIRPCSFSEHSFGSLVEKPLTALWRRKAMSAWAGEYPGPCAPCAMRFLCLGGCRAVRERFQVRCDTLMEEPLAQGPVAPMALPVTGHDLESRPRALFKTRKESFGYALIHGGEVVPVLAGARPLVASYGGEKSLAEIRARFGEEGMAFTLFLARRGFIELS
ncbi:MAG: radical SAM protein [Candidatus Eremiobacteraeota bacterium]|nr:radical SAM protein [Candidatus Eremiobacteraeota bacterium]